MGQKINEQVVYIHGGFDVPLRERKCPEERCYGCHEHGIYEEIVEMTPDLEQEFGANPGAFRHGAMECPPCHQMHEESPLINGCYACHHERTLESCSTCH